MTYPSRLEPRADGKEQNPPSGGSWVRAADGGLTPANEVTAAMWHEAYGHVPGGTTWGDVVALLAFDDVSLLDEAGYCSVVVTGDFGIYPPPGPVDGGSLGLGWAGDVGARCKVTIDSRPAPWAAGQPGEFTVQFTHQFSSDADPGRCLWICKSGGHWVSIGALAGHGLSLMVATGTGDVGALFIDVPDYSMMSGTQALIEANFSNRLDGFLVARLFVDGALIGEMDVPADAVVGVLPAEFYIGNAPPDWDAWAGGAFDEFRLLSVADHTSSYTPVPGKFPRQ